MASVCTIAVTHCAPIWVSIGCVSGAVLSRGRRGGEVCKEDVRGVPLRDSLNKTMPLIHPIEAAASAGLFVPLPTGDGELTGGLPAEGTAQSLPETRIEEGLFHRHQKRGVVIVSRPGGELPARSHIGGGHPARAVNVIASCDGGVECLCDDHGGAPLAVEGGPAHQSLIVHRSLTLTALVHELRQSDRALPPLLNRLHFHQERLDSCVFLHRLLAARLLPLGHGLCSLALFPCSSPLNPYHIQRT